MLSIKARNVQQALPEILYQSRLHGVEDDSRNGKVFLFPEPVSVCYEKPMERVLFWKERDANPFFHLFESLWMLAGRNDVPFLTQFIKRMTDFSDDGKTFHGAYGYRWRKCFGMDQLAKIIEALKNNPKDRRQVLQMWESKIDLGRQGKDVPCNIIATFQRKPSGELDMVVYNRSNDTILGALGANVVHFSILQEYIAAGIGCPVGRYWQVSSNMHIYDNQDLEKIKELADLAADGYRNQASLDPYEFGSVNITPIVDLDLKTWNQDLEMWFENPNMIGLRSKFFRRVAVPMFNAHKAYKNKDIVGAYEILEQCTDGDWKVACKEWLDRRGKVKDERTA